MEPPSPSRSFLFFRSSLHFSLNKRIINRLRMTGPPLILLSSVPPKSLHNLPSAFVPPEEVLQMKGGWKGDDRMSLHNRPPPSAGRFDSRWKEEGRNRFPLVGRKNAVIFMDSVIARQAILGISRLLLIFLPLLWWIQRTVGSNSR